MKKIVGIVIAMLLFPWLASLAWSGAAREIREDGRNVAGTEAAGEASIGAEDGESHESDSDGSGSDGLHGIEVNASGGNLFQEGGEDIDVEDKGMERRILVKRKEIQTYIELEDYLPGVIVCQISQESEMEALKCQAVIARTYIHRLMDGRSEIREEELDLDYLSENQRNIPWDREKTAQYLEQCRQAVMETAGVVMQYEGRDILPLFHAVSAGRTRSGDESYPYLQSVESRWDTQREDYLQTIVWGLPEFAGLINEIPGAAEITAEQLPSQIQTVKKDDAGYVMQMKVGAKTYTGEEIQYALRLPSSCFTMEGNSEEIRATAKGMGHGYGLSQAGADAMAREGWGYQDILNYYYKNISLISE